MVELSRKEYFRQYYLNNKNNKNKNVKKTNKKRGRPKIIIAPFSVTRLDKPIKISFD